MGWVLYIYVGGCGGGAAPVLDSPVSPEKTVRPEEALEEVALFPGPMPTGVTVSRKGRIFVCFPRWGDVVPFTVAEIRSGVAVPYPSSELNLANGSSPAEVFASVQSVIVDARDRLWILDTGRIEMNPPLPGGAKLVGIDLATGEVFKTILFPPETVLPTTYLNDVRFDLRKGPEGVAYITDSSDRGPGAIIVVDLATGRSQRRLSGHPSTQAEPGFLPLVESFPLMHREIGEARRYLQTGADGIALSHDGSLLFYCPLAARRLFAVSTDALRDEAFSDLQVSQTVHDLGQKPASDGLECDRQGRIYATAYEHQAVVRRDAMGIYETIVKDPRLLWPDTLSISANGYLYITSNQLHRQPGFNEGRDQRVRPFGLFRIKIDDGPVDLPLAEGPLREGSQ